MDTIRPPVRGKALLRRGRFSETGRIYLVTFVTAGRLPLFAHWVPALTATHALRAPHLWCQSQLLCWVLMPDHWHGLIELGDGDNLSALVGRIKGASAHAVNAQRQVRGHVWTDGFHDHAVRSQEDILDIARYIILNPVRAAIVKRVADYPFWDAVWIDAVRSRG